ncbi:SDR family oxidoreductase [Aeribacillus composti]|uniref:oxidoreductase n=1 Tax=Aeribacillus TaxID=1055323 RepID=UPI00119901E7|nr:oxidoreductase [Aeribacillus composti]MED0716379.1 oxidoreductase [Aeribacillus composti]MED0747211.1 oxidoreductase [Aeribacillus composti]TVZ76323.1 NADP-dependent 3-hydroxy acid dehydrogenase YdfG [Aeribacillus composti]
MNQTLKKQPVAFVTGASSGFGLLTSVALAGEGYRVLASMRDLDKRGRLKAAAKEAGVTDRIEIIQLDVNDFSAAETVIQNVIEEYGQIDLLVNNAGYAAGGFTEELAVEEWRRQFETNFFGLVAVTKAVLPSMRARRSGKVVNISSISGRIGFPSMGPYVASKFAVEGFSESLRLEMLPYGVHVVLIEPGSYKTEIWSKGLDAVSVNPDSPYVKEMEKILKYVNHVADTAPSPYEVIQQIVHVAKSPYPKLRYPVGKGVKLGIVLKNILPWKWWERMVTKRLWERS